MNKNTKKIKLESYVYLNEVSYQHPMKDYGEINLDSCNPDPKANGFDVYIKTHDEKLAQEFLRRMKSAEGYRFKLTLEQVDWSSTI